MEEVTDKFYSHFPSYTEQQKRERELLAQNRRKDYQNYLKQMPLNDDIISRSAIRRSLRKPAVNVENETTKNRSGGETIVTRAIIESRSRKIRWVLNWWTDSNQPFCVFLFFFFFIFVGTHSNTLRRKSSMDSPNMDLPDIFDDNAIRERNRKVIEVRIRWIM